MTTTLVKPQVQIEPTRRRFSVAEYYAMAKAGILTEDERVGTDRRRDYCHVANWQRTCRKRRCRD